MDRFVWVQHLDFSWRVDWILWSAEMAKILRIITQESSGKPKARSFNLCLWFLYGFDMNLRYDLKKRIITVRPGQKEIITTTHI